MKARILTLAAAATIIAAPVAAQSATANLSATATVVAVLGVVGTPEDLRFGSVFPGLVDAVPPTDANSASVEFSGAANAEVTLDWGTLPTQLVDGGNTLPIAFSNSDASWNTVNNRGTATSFDPATVETTNLSGGGSLWVYLGGTVTPAAAQAQGNYTAALSLVATYTGN